MRRIAKLVRRIGAAALCLGLATGAATACPNWATQRTAFGGGQLTAGFMPDPIEVPRITAGGRHFLGDCFPGTNFTGFVITRPDYRLQYSGTSPTGYLKFTAARAPSPAPCRPRHGAPARPHGHRGSAGSTIPLR
jgi:hypothetical protein